MRKSLRGRGNSKCRQPQAAAGPWFESNSKEPGVAGAKWETPRGQKDTRKPYRVGSTDGHGKTLGFRPSRWDATGGF